MGGEVAGEPGRLIGNRTRVAREVALRVEDDDVPRADVVAVPPTARVGRGRAERRELVAEVAHVPGRVGIDAVVVVAERRPGSRLRPTPTRVVAIGELGGGSILIRVVAERDNSRARE